MPEPRLEEEQTGTVGCVYLVCYVLGSLLNIFHIIFILLSISGVELLLFLFD